VIEHGVVMANGPKITLRDLPLTLREESRSGARAMPLKGDAFNLHESEHRLIQRALEECNGNKSKAAIRLGISRRTLHRKLNEMRDAGKSDAA